MWVKCPDFESYGKQYAELSVNLKDFRYALFVLKPKNTYAPQNPPYLFLKQKV
jgi:hypothetical protein